MKKVLIIIGIILAIILLVFSFYVTVDNRAISLEEQICSAESDIKIQEKRRTDLIYNLADCVKEYDKHESDTLLDIVEARKTDNKLEIENVSTELSLVAEAYPELKANEVYKDLMNELAITENLIAEHRKTYNDQIREYSKYVKKFPNKQILNSMDHKIVEYTYLDYSEEETKSINNLFGEKN